MKVTLINHTQHARETLVLTKNTRLLSGVTLDEVNQKTDEQLQKELDYMVNTIKSSWEFVDFTFMIEGVSRGFTHQFVRNRLGSYAQQTMRILDMSGFDYITGPSIANDPKLQLQYEKAMEQINHAYQTLIAMGAKVEDARGILPTNISTNIVAKFNLRALSQMMLSRASSRTQGEYRDVLDAMYNAVVSAEPWCDKFLRSGKYEALKQIESILKSDYEGTELLIPYLKLIDKVRND
jgi:flavin-dependent thymidylate synthase